MNDHIDPNLFRQFLKTQEDATEFQLLLDTLSEKLFQTETPASDLLAKEASYEKAIAVKRIAEEYNVNVGDRTKLAEFLALLHNSVTALPVVHLTFAVSPKKQLVTIIHDWFYTNFHRAVLLEIEVNPAITAGSIIKFNGKYADYSLEKQIANIVPRDES